MEKNQDEISFEEALHRLEEIVQQLEEGEVPLSCSLTLFQEGMKRARQCNRFLQEAEEQINILLENEEGVLTVTPHSSFSSEGEGE